MVKKAPWKVKNLMHTRWDKSMFTVHMGNNTIIINNARINSVLCTHNCKPVSAPAST